MSYIKAINNVITFYKGMLEVRIYPDREIMGLGAAKDVSLAINELLNEKEEINVIFAAAPSQSDFIKELISDESIQWERINAFHMDEYIGLDEDAPQGFGNYLKKHLFDKVPFNSVNIINGFMKDVEGECNRYAELLDKYPVDIVCFGIGENGHIAFNDPPVANFNDPDRKSSCRERV